MSETIKSAVPCSGYTAEIGPASYGNGTVRLAISDGVELASMTLPRAAFIAAIESELGVKLVPADAIVIERSELPEVRQELAILTAFDGEDRLASRSMDHDPRGARRVGIALLALAEHLAEHLAAHPPVDQATVDALESALAQWGVQAIGGAPVRNVARDLAEQFTITRKDGAR